MLANQVNIHSGYDNHCATSVIHGATNLHSPNLHSTLHDTHNTNQSAIPRTPTTVTPSHHHLGSSNEEIPNNGLGALIIQLKQILGPNKGLSSKDIDIEAVKKLMEDYQSTESDWAKFALHDATRNYTRNGIIDINGNANLLLLCWSPGKSSAIHDHANAHCCMKILKGNLKESLYDIPVNEGGELVPKSESVLSCQQVGYISDDIGLHKISNPDDEMSVSLHLYTPPYASMYGCSMYEATNGKKHHVDMSKYYSWQGELVNANGGSRC